MTLGDRLKKARTNKGLTLEEAGNLIGTTKQNIYKYENGIITNVPSDKIEALAKIYEVSPSFFRISFTFFLSAKSVNPPA